ncbi:MAG: hypothetical protein J7M14_05645 [Planctomycetes bacterium]|nr:hypothetical protein [Planctomycetota bacterium]
MIRSIPMALVCLMLSVPCWAVKANTAATRNVKKIGRSADKAAKTADVRAALKRETRNFSSNSTLDRTLNRIATMADVIVAVDRPALKAAGVVADKKLHIVARKARLEQLLDLALAKASPKGKPLAWSVSSGVVIVTTQEGLLGRRRQQIIRGRLRHPSTLKGINFEETALVDVIDFLREVTHLNFHTNWGALKAIGVTRQTPVTLRLSNVSPATVLDYITKQISTSSDKFQRVHWVFDGGIVRISTGSALNTDLRTRTFDIGAMLHMPAAVGAPQVSQLGRGVSTSRGGGAADGRSAASGGKENVKEDIIALIKNAIGQDMWRDSGRGKGSIRVIGSNLVISQTPLGFKLLEKALGRRRRGR